MMYIPKVSRALLEAMRAGLADIEDLARSVGLDPTMPEHASVEQVYDLFSLAAAKSPPWFGLIMGTHIDSELFDVVAANSTTLGEGLQKLAYHKHEMSGEWRDIVREAERTTIRFKLTEGPFARQRQDFETSFSLRCARHLVGDEALEPVRVAFEFERPAPEYYAHYVSTFKCEIFFNARNSELVFNSVDWARPISRASGDVPSSITQRGGRLDERWRGRNKSSRVREVLRTKPSSSIEEVAARLNLNRRDLQRQLQEEGNSFTQLVEEVKIRIACRCLQTEGYNLRKLRLELGYDTEQKLLRALEQWSRKSPELRELLERVRKV
ncbi:AraC family transcriptional regulator ligand-binding domain-containing protein [Pendulispora brunnea]|uniref:AraC family transcriptional regulator ligand-binding domain-containing protein n=1 Tax=Pendulispora brunnea TaxID=2905690 RepID=A0ABZ2KDG9_9BACT